MDTNCCLGANMAVFREGSLLGLLVCQGGLANKGHKQVGFLFISQ